MSALPEVQLLRGGLAIRPWIAALAQLRIRVFAEWPYLYEGSLDYESQYLSTYLQSPDVLLVLVRDGEAVVGASTALPLRDESAQLREPFAAAGYDVQHIVYFGESVLLPAYRGLGLGHRFFDAREAHARTLGATHSAFCAVQRDDDDPRRPASARALNGFWRARGYAPVPGLNVHLDWLETAAELPQSHVLNCWMHTL